MKLEDQLILLRNIVPGLSSLDTDCLRRFAESEEIQTILTYRDLKERQIMLKNYACVIDGVNVCLDFDYTELHTETFNLLIVSDAFTAPEMIHSVLQRYIPAFLWLIPEQQTTVIATDYSKEFYLNIVKYNKSIDGCKKTWCDAFHHGTNFTPSREQTRLLKQAKSKLSLILPNEEDISLYNSLEYLYSEQSEADKKKYLLKKFNEYLKNHGLEELATAELMNEVYQVCTNINEAVKLPFVYLVKGVYYSMKWLVLYLGTSIYNGARFVYNDQNSNYINDMGDTHLAFQAAHLSGSEGEYGSHEFLDLVNYHRYRSSISKFKTVLYYFFTPLASFFDEYWEIALYEPSLFWFTVRTIMPFAVMLTCVIFTFSMIAPFALHALLEILILLPVIYLGIAVASLYVDLKNYLHDKLLTFFYNDPYSTRYYQVNPSLLTMANKDQQFVKDVTQLYIDNLKECDALIKDYENNVICPERRLNEKNSILHEKSQLQQEWHAIRDDNKQFSIDDKQNLIKSRIKKNKTHEYQQLKRCFNSYADQVIVEAKIESNKDRMSFFRSDESRLDDLKKPCIDHEEKILRLDRIYSKV